VGARPAGSAILSSGRLSSAIRFISSSVSAKSKRSRFSAMRAALDERGIGIMLPCWMSQRSAIGASGRPLRAAMSASTGSRNGRQRAESGEDQTALAAGFGELRLVEMGVILGLQVDQRLGAEADGFIEHGDVEIGNADMAREALPLGFGQRGNGLAQRNVRVGPMHEQKVDEIDVEIFQALLDRAREIVRAQVFVRDFGGQKNV